MTMTFSLTLTLRSLLCCVATVLLISSAYSSAHAQPYPNKPIRLIVPYAAGGPVDMVSRLIAEGSKTTLGTELATLDAAAFARFVAQEHAKYEAIVKAANVRVE